MFEQEIAETVANGSAESVFGILEQETVAQLDVVVFSCSVFEPEKGMSRRIYTNRSDVYPVSGLKPIVPNRWTKKVLDEHQPFVANRLEDLVDIFPDHELIGSLGCGAIINMPVVCGGQLMGTVNLLGVPGQYSDEDVAYAQSRLWLAQIAFMMSALEAGRTPEDTQTNGD